MDGSPLTNSPMGVVMNRYGAKRERSGRMLRIVMRKELGTQMCETSIGAVTPTSQAISTPTSVPAANALGTLSATDNQASTEALYLALLAALTGQPAAPALQSFTGAQTLTPVSGDPLMTRVQAAVAGSPIASQALGEMQRAGVKIVTMDNATFSAKYKGASGVYEPSSDTIVLPESTVNDPRKLALVLFHEGIHWLQDSVGSPSKLASLGGPIGNALLGANALRDAPRGNPIAHETQAYVLEAAVAKELGVYDGGLGTQNGRVLSYDEVAQRVSSNALYQ